MVDISNELRAIKNWTFAEGRALIAAYQNRKDEYFQTRKKIDFWSAVLTDLEASNVLVSSTTPQQVETKWKTLYRAYKSAKDRGTGTSASKFLYMEEMDSIFHDNPLISSTFAISVGVNNNPKPAQTKENENFSGDKENNDPIKENNKDPVRKHIKKTQASKSKRQKVESDAKEKYYEFKIEEERKRTQMIKEYLEKKEKAKAERHFELVKILKEKKQT